MNLNDMTTEIALVNADKGWYAEERSFGDLIALLHSEVSEALEAYRDWGFEDATPFQPMTFGQTIPKPEGVGAELADVLIRLLDTAYRYNIDLETEYRRKMDYNKTRPYRHGGKKL